MKPASSPSTPRTLLLALTIFAVFGCRAFADGGRLRFRQPAGPFIVTLFTAPDPLTTGPADFSVAVERPGVPGLVENAHVDIVLTPADRKGKPLLLHVSRAAATSKWLQAVNFFVPAPGPWQVKVVVRRGSEVGQCSGELRIGAAGPRDLTWDVLPVPLAALFFVLHQNRKRKYSRGRRHLIS